MQTYVLVDAQVEAQIRDKYTWARRSYDAAIVNFDHDPTDRNDRAIDEAWGVLVGVRETAALLGIVLR